MISEMVAQEMGKLLKVAKNKSKDKATCSVKLWCCHPTDSRAECLGTVEFDEVSEGQDAFFAPEEHFEKDILKKAEYIELLCEDEEEPILRKNPDYDDKEGHPAHGDLEVVLITEEAPCSDCDDKDMQSLAKLMATVAKIAIALENRKHPLYKKADGVLFNVRSLLKSAIDKRDLAAILGDGFPEGTEVDYKKRTISVPVLDEETGDVTDVVELPMKFSICSVCEGHGKYVDPNIDRHGITSSELEEMEQEELDAYFGGSYDVDCKACKGTGKQVEVDETLLNEEQKETYKKVQEVMHQQEKERLYDERTMRMESGQW